MATQKQTVLIVDDVELNRAILHDLMRPNYEILEAADGKAAVDLLDRNHDRIAIVFLDIIMPVMDGFGVLQHMNEHGYIRRIPVFMITAESSADVINRGYDMGADDVIQKPFNPSIILRRVKNTVELYKRRFEMEAMIREQSDEILKQAEKIRNFNVFLIDALSTAVEFRDCESGEHIRRIRGITRMLLQEVARVAPRYGITEEQIDQISLASAMHDIGKIAIPDYILKKPGRLTDEEFAVMKEHTTRGCRLLERVNVMKDDPQYRYYSEICRWHHEKWDGGGYPDGLKGDKIPIWAQVVGVADCYDALVSKRVYKKAYAHETAVQMILDGECGAFNPIVLDCFKRIAPRLEEAIPAETVWMMPLDGQEFPAESERSLQGVDFSDRAIKLLDAERRRYRILTTMSNEIVFTYYRDSDRLEFSDRFVEIFGGDPCIDRPRERILRDSRLLSEDAAKIVLQLDTLTDENPSFTMEFRARTLKGDEWFELTVLSFWDEEDTSHCESMVGRLRSIEEYKQELQLWKDQANIDSLTGILNRYGLMAAVAHILEGPERRQRFAFFMLDMDNFKQINDTRGHLFGDKVLKKVANILVESLRTTDVMGRIGGDEFVFVMRNVESTETVTHKAIEIGEKIRKFGEHEGMPFTASLGIAMYPRNGYSFRVLLEKADKALYTAKQAGRDATRFYTSAMESKDYISVISKPDCE